MSTSVSSVAERPAEPTRDDRGQTKISDLVVEKIIVQTVREVDHAAGSARRLWGMSLGSARRDTDVSVSARVDGQQASVVLTMTVLYPASVRDVTRRIRERVRAAVHDLAGVDVQQVDITVTGMRVKPDAPARVR